MIDFNVPTFTGREFSYMKEAVDSKKICGDGQFTKKCEKWIEERFSAKKVLLTTSATSALEMACYLSGIRPGDEVILPSFTFSSTANAPVLFGARLVFVDIRPDTMNIDEKKIEEAITEKTKAIIAVHYAGVSCEMDDIMDIAARHKLKVIEDAAQGIMSEYKGRPLGTIGDFGCFSFHETKNYSMGEGGAILINNENDILPAEIMREKGTNRAQYFRGQIDKYSWVDYGSSYLPSDINAAYLWAQLEIADEINKDRLSTWEKYDTALRPLEKEGKLSLAVIPEECVHNAHMYYVKLKDLSERTAFISHLKENGVQSAFHYVPLHSAPAGRKFGRFSGEDEFTTKESERLTRLPMYYGISDTDVSKVIAAVKEFF